MVITATTILHANQLVFDMVAHRGQPSYEDQAHHNDTTLLL